MALQLRQLASVLDCRDPERLGDFWAAVLGYRRGGFHPPYLRVTDPTGHGVELLLQQVPEEKAGKNRMHLDLRLQATEAMQPAVDEVIALGASVIRGPWDDAGWLTTVLADPEGNEFCVLVAPVGWR